MPSRLERQRFFAILDTFDREQADSDHNDGQAPAKKHKLDALIEKGQTHVSGTTEAASDLSSNLQNPQPRSALWNLAVRPSACALSPRVSTIRANDQTVAKDVQPPTPPGHLFRDLHFYFIPNDDVAKPRKLRIRSAINQGATWSRVLDDKVTHIIVDGEVDAAAVAKLRQLRSIELKPHLHIVRSSWLIECLSQKELRDPGQGRFQLRGAAVTFAHLYSVKKAFKRVVSKPYAFPPTPQFTKNSPQRSNAYASGELDSLDQIIQDVRGALQSGTEDPDMTGLLAWSSFEDEVPNDSTMSDRPRAEGESFQTAHQDRIGLPASNPNVKTIEILQKMASYYACTGNTWRALGYRKAITALKRQKTMIATAEQAHALPAIGPRLADKIEEIVTTSHLRRLDATIQDPSDNALQLFMGVYGVGYKQARIWVSQGHRTLEDLRTKANLTDIQSIGLERYHDFTQRIPRSEVEKHGAIVSRALHRADPQLTAIIGGSYRRGNDDSGDIDILITSKDDNATSDHIRDIVVTKLVPALTQVGFLKCVLASSFRGSSITADQITASKWHGASALPSQPNSSTPPWRRIDLLIAPPSELGAALLYFTGNDILNRSMRLLASKKGMRLNQRGLYTDVIRGHDRAKLTEGRLLEGRSEKKIFEILGVPWREPTDRNC